MGWEKKKKEKLCRFVSKTIQIAPSRCHVTWIKVLKLFLAHVIYYFATEMELEKESIRISRKKPTEIGEFLYFKVMEAYMDHVIYLGAYMVQWSLYVSKSTI